MEEQAADWSSYSAPDAMLRFAPVGYDIFLRTVGAFSAPRSIMALIRHSCGTAIGLTPLSEPLLTEHDAGDLLPSSREVMVSFVEQFSVDVSSIDSAKRAGFLQEFGDKAQSILCMAYVADMAPRVMAALDRLFRAPQQGWPRVVGHRANASDVKNDFLRIVYSLHALDPVLSEMIRLRGATQHNCRLCKSVLSRPAILFGADGTIFETVENYKTGGLPENIKAALAMVDAMIWQPSNIPQEVIDGIRANFTPGQAIEIVLDVMRNAVNKVAVALDMDGAHVTEGFEVYEYFEDGHMEFGLG